MCAGVGFLAGVRADVSCLQVSGPVHCGKVGSHLVFETVKSPVTERTLVWPRDLALIHVQRRLRQSPNGRIVRVQSTGDGVRDGRR